MSSSINEESTTSTPSTAEEQPSTPGDDESGDANLYPPPSAGETNALREIFDKQYEEGDVGKLDALHDLQSVFDELEKQKVISGFDILAAYNAPPTAEVVNKPPVKANVKSRRSEALTPRPSAGLFGRGHSEVKISSLPNLKTLSSRSKQLGFMNEATASLPILNTDPPKQKSHSRKSKSKKSHGKKSSRRYKGQELCVSDAIDIVQKDLELVTSTEFRRPPSSASVDMGDNAEEDIDDAWKADVNKVTRARTSTKSFTRSGEDETLQLKYKPPIWPHQQCLNQILARVSQLTCLILDGSEIQFLRDLGSSLQSLETLSVCKCGLRSVDGTFGFPNLRTFIASDNEIQHPIQCSYLPYLNYLDLSGNPIEGLKNFIHLRSCKRLRSLKLHSTPVSKISDFSQRMKTILPQVQEIFPISTYSKAPKPKNPKKEDEDARDPLQAMMRQDLNMVYKKIVDNPKPPGIGYQHFRTSEYPLGSATSPGTATSTDDNLESTFINSIHKQNDITTESYVTEVDEEDNFNVDKVSTSETPGSGEITTDFSYGDARNFLNTESSVPPGPGESTEEIFMLRKQNTSTEVEDTETEGYGDI